MKGLADAKWTEVLTAAVACAAPAVAWLTFWTTHRESSPLYASTVATNSICCAAQSKPSARGRKPSTRTEATIPPGTTQPSWSFLYH